LKPHQQPGLESPARRTNPVCRLADFLEKVETYFCFAALAAIAAITVLQVLARLTKHPVIWTAEVASGLLIWLSLLAAAVMTRKAQHVRVVFLTDALGPRGQTALSILNHILMLVFCGYMTVAAYDLYRIQMKVSVGALQVPRSYYFALPTLIFSVSCIIFLIARLLEQGIWGLHTRQSLIERRPLD